MILKFTYKFVLFLLNIIISLNRKLYKYNLENHEILDSVIPTTDNYASSYDSGKHITAVHLKKNYKIHRLTTNNGKILDCADEHLVYTGFEYNKYAKDLKLGEPVYTRTGYEKIRKNEVIGYEPTFDLTIASEDKLYFTNDILSHNSITSGIFIAWYLCFQTDRNVMVTSENGDKVEELVDKIDVIMRELPFFIKPGMRVNNIYTKVYDNGCKLKAQKTTENTGASFTIHLLYCDEFALVNKKYLNAFFRTIYPTLSSSNISKMVITSTARGMNKFYEIYDNAVNGKNDFNPMRTDWWEVPKQDNDGNPLLDENGNILYRDEKWKQSQVETLGSEEDFNQEFGNQFDSGSDLLFGSEIMRSMRVMEKKFIPHEFYSLEDIDFGFDYRRYLTWHPQFRIEELLNQKNQFVVSIDLSDGGGGDYQILNFFQILPMTANEIDRQINAISYKDYFKLVQIGLFRCNSVSIEIFAKFVYHFLAKSIISDNVKLVLEMNHEGNYFKSELSKISTKEGDLDLDLMFAKYKKRIDSDIMTVGMWMNDPLKEYLCKKWKSLAKYGRLVISEKITITESVGYGRNKSGVYEGQTRNDDCATSTRNLANYFDTGSYLEQLEELLDTVSKKFLSYIDAKNGKKKNGDIDDDIDELIYGL